MATILKPIRKNTEEVISEFPIRFESFFEPFLNVGEVFFNLFANGRIFNSAYLSSLDRNIVNVYNAVRDEPERLEKIVSNLLEKNSLSTFNSAKLAEFSASSYIYLNRASNDKGEWRASQFVDRNKKISTDISEIDTCSRYLNRWCSNIWHTKWDASLTRVKEGDVVYLEPAKIPYTADGRIDYRTDDFCESSQIYLNNFCKQLKSRNCFICLIQSDTPGTLWRYGKPKKTLSTGELLYAY